MLYVGYVHLTSARPIHKRHTYLHVRKDDTFSCKKNLVVILKGFGAKTNRLAVNFQS
jgi:hypothetical protein